LNPFFEYSKMGSRETCMTTRTSSGPAGEPARRRLLLGEDEPTLREMLAEALQHEGFEVVSAADGVEVLRLFADLGPFDALVLDHDMPRLPGRDVLCRLRHDGLAVPVVLCSGRLELSDDERARLRVGPVLRKPFTLRELLDAIRTAFERDEPD
jgi:DNA-binding response OmpR family regulator